MHIAMQGQEFDLTGAQDTVELVGKSPIFVKWLKRIDARFRIKRVEVQAADTRFHGGLLFAKLKAEVVDHEGQWVPGAVFLRGDAVAVLIVLRCGGKEHVLLVSQPRFPAGVFASIEIPAGMIDEHSTAIETAVREVEEETHINVTADQLRCLGEYYPSGGGSDEKITCYVCELETSAEQLAAMQGAAGGVEHEHERITMLVVPLDELPKHTCDAKALLSYGWYRGWER